MDRETARQEIRNNWRQILQGMTSPAKQRVNGEKSYICPICGNGQGSSGDGLTRNPKSKGGNGLKCFKCDFSGDIIDLYQQVNGTDYNTALSLLAGEIGINIDEYTPTAAEDFADSRTTTPAAPQSHETGAGHTDNPAATKSPTEGAETPTDYTAYYKECRERLNDPAALAYLKKRGLSPETAAAYWIGFDPEADPASAPGGSGQKYHPTPRLIIPTTKSHYVGRRVDGKEQFTKVNSKGSSPGFFNLKALYTQDVQEVFITEGAIDALSIIEQGAAAIATNSTANAEALIKQLEKKRTAATLILCFDNDPSGEKATETIKAGLQRLNISFITANIAAGYKDPNEALTADKEAFAAAIAEAKQRTAAKPDNTQYYIDALMGGDINRFKQEIKTGFDNLDAKAGGLYAGLYVLAAISSLGKTSFALQMADQIAEAGNDVLFFSLEQSRLELVSKSIARRTAQKDREKAVTSLQIRKGYKAEAAAKEYIAAVGDRISIIEGNFNCNVSFIGDYVRQYIRRNNTRPVVIVDYLQILQPAEDKRQTTKEVIDTTITELKRLSREQDITIVAISSVNRANYLTPIDFESLKESGSVEYSADVVLGLQLQCLNDDIFSKESKLKEKRAKVKEAKAANPRQIELVCLKNRYGIANYSCYFDYYPANDLFVESLGGEWEDAEPDTTGAIRL